MKAVIGILFVGILLALAFSCAKQSVPTGGPKDTIPPQRIKAIPPDKTTNFKGNVVQLQFDETVIVNNPREQLLITPSIGKDVEMTAKKKTVTLKLNEKLKDSTTYTINFRESVQDITEKNPAKNLHYAFSTGDYLDSLTITGKVFYILNGKGADDATVALYNNPDTFNIFKHKPDYLTRTDKEGTFHLENLKAGDYFIYAFNDKNTNIIVDSKTESYGFITEPLHLAPNKKESISIPILSLDARELKLISARPYNTYFNIKLTKNIKDFSIDTNQPNDSSILHYSFAEDHSNIKIYTPPLDQDSLKIKFTAIDSIGFQLDTILYVKSNPRKSTPEKFSFNVEKPNVILNQEIFTANIKFNKPITAINYDSIVYKVDSLTQYSFSDENFTWNRKENLLKISLPVDQTPYQKQENKAGEFNKSIAPPKTLINKLLLGKGAFISIENDTTSHKEEIVSILQPDNTGTIIVQTDLPSENVILQLLTPDFKIFESAIHKNAFTFNNLPPGNYTARAIRDQNSNEKWDPGNFFRREEPEEIYFYTNEENSSTISVKANWELGPLLITPKQHVDNQK